MAPPKEHIVRNPIRVTAALPIALALVLGACGSSGTKTNAASASTSANADGNKAAFCVVNAQINSGTKAAATPDQFVTLLAPFEPSLVAFAADAPASVKADAQLLVDTAHKALSTNDGTGFADPLVAQAGKNVDAFCGVSTSSS
jgi:hypothetical protein